MFLFANDTVTYTDILKDMTKKTELISNYSKVAEYKVNILSVVFLYTNNEKVEFEIKNTFPTMIHLVI